MSPDFLPGVANHLWQSTGFAIAAGLLTLTMRQNSARVRHWIWVATSLKFLVPCSLLVALGSRVSWRTALVPEPTGFVVTLDHVGQSFASPAGSLAWASEPGRAKVLPAILVLVWLCGFIGITASWWIRRRRFAASVRAGSRVDIGLPLRAISSPTVLEPGVFGVFRPVLVLPDAIFEHLTPEQWKSILAHELCHVRHRDNLIATVQMFVEAVFWFYPLVWWLGKRMFDERERACDEEVLRLGSEPRTYAQGILKVCEFYLSSPLECVAGISGGSLQSRIDAIMSNRGTRELGRGRRLLLAGVGMLAVAVPILIGVNAPAGRAQAQSGGTPAKFEVASIKPNLSGRAGWDGVKISHGNLSVANASVRMLMEEAFHVQKARIAGGPAWIATERFDINAKGDPAVTRRQVMEMLQLLLMERFRLVVHYENRNLPIYALVPLKSASSKLRKPSEACGTEADAGAERPASSGPVDFMHAVPCGAVAAVGAPQGGVLWGRSASLASIADGLSNLTDRPVVDRTGLQGEFEFQLRWMAEGSPSARNENERPRETSPLPEAPASIFTAVQEQLGLKLEAARGPVSVLVIDRIERPSGN